MLGRDLLVVLFVFAAVCGEVGAGSALYRNFLRESCKKYCCSAGRTVFENCVSEESGASCFQFRQAIEDKCGPKAVVPSQYWVKRCAKLCEVELKYENDYADFQLTDEHGHEESAREKACSLAWSSSDPCNWSEAKKQRHFDASHLKWSKEQSLLVKMDRAGAWGPPGK